MDNAVTLAVRQLVATRCMSPATTARARSTMPSRARRKGRYPDGMRPDWVSGDERADHRPRRRAIRALSCRTTGPRSRSQAFGTDRSAGRGPQGRRPTCPKTCPTGSSASDRRVASPPTQGASRLTGARTEVFNYFLGWELFWFTLDSPYHGQGLVADPVRRRSSTRRARNYRGAVS